MRRIFDIVAKNWLLVIIIILAAFLRFYRIEEFAMFLADQGRDAIIIKRIVTGEHFPAIGAPTSVGQVYLGPFYYYFIAPWLLIFNFNPAGLAWGSALTSIAFLIVLFYIVKSLFNSRAAYISIFIASFSYVLIQSSRFSWNPNPLPFFSLLTAYSLFLAVKSGKTRYFFIFGAFLSFCIQLHYLAAALALPILVLAVFDLIGQGKNFAARFLKYILSFISFLIFTLPLVIFDLRHEFINSKSFIKLLDSGTGVGAGKFANLIQSFSDINKYLFNIEIGSMISMALLIIMTLLLITVAVKKNYNLAFILAFLLFSLAVVSFYPGVKHAHYLGMIYPFYIILIAATMGEIFKHGFIDRAVVIFFLAAFLYLNFQKYDFLWSEPNNQIRHAARVADFLDKQINVDSFSVAVQPDGWHEDSYLYFLELKGKVPQDRRELKVGKEMFVICGNPCDIKSTKSWNITIFGKFKIASEWSVEGVKIYRLVK